MTNCEIKPLDPLDQAAVDGAIDAIDASGDVDSPDFPATSRAGFIVGLTRTSMASTTHHLVAERDGKVIGYASAMLPGLDNKHLVEIELDVHPEHRRAGVGSALLAEIERIARADARTVLLAYVPDTVEGRPLLPHNGQHFAARHGFETKTTEIRRCVDLTGVDEAALDELLAAAWAKAADYELVTWINHAPDDLIEALAYLDSRMNLDAPTGDLTIEATTPDPARMRDHERRSITSGKLRVATAVRHRRTGAVAGWTDIVVVPGDEENAWQGITIVDPEHRGHRLGTILKIVNQRRLREYRPRMRFVTTWNDEANDFMVNINESVGYRARERWLAMERKLA